MFPDIGYSGSVGNVYDGPLVSKETIESVAKILDERGAIYCESVLLKEWMPSDWPIDNRIFRLVDAYLNLFRAMKLYHNNDR